MRKKVNNRWKNNRYPRWYAILVVIWQICYFFRHYPRASGPANGNRKQVATWHSRADFQGWIDLLILKWYAHVGLSLALIGTNTKHKNPVVINVIIVGISVNKIEIERNYLWNWTIFRWILWKKYPENIYLNIFDNFCGIHELGLMLIRWQLQRGCGVEKYIAKRFDTVLQKMCV